MPMIWCDVREGHAKEQKRALARENTHLAHETIDGHVEYIYVLIRETPGYHHVKASVTLEAWRPNEGAMC